MAKKEKVQLTKEMKKQNRKILRHQIYVHRELYLFMLPAIVAVIIFKYWPMNGLLMAFQNVKIGRTIWENPWVGFKWFERFFNGTYFTTVLKNTILISLLTTLATMPFPIILSLLIYNSPSRKLGKAIQNITYIPHLLSIVLVMGVLSIFCNGSSGLINILLKNVGLSQINFYGEEAWVYPLYVISDIWQATGYSAVVYIGALSAVDHDLIEAAQIDGANKLKRVLYIQLPCIMPTVATMLILNVGKLFNVGADKMLLLQTNLNIGASEIISTYVYKLGFEGSQYGFSTAVNLFQNVINLILVLLVNRIVKKLADVSIF